MASREEVEEAVETQNVNGADRIALPKIGRNAGCDIGLGTPLARDLIEEGRRQTISPCSGIWKTGVQVFRRSGIRAAHVLFIYGWSSEGMARYSNT